MAEQVFSDCTTSFLLNGRTSLYVVDQQVFTRFYNKFVRDGRISLFGMVEEVIVKVIVELSARSVCVL